MASEATGLVNGHHPNNLLAWLRGDFDCRDDGSHLLGCATNG